MSNDFHEPNCKTNHDGPCANPSQTEARCPQCQATDNNPYRDANGRNMRACGRCMIQWEEFEQAAPEPLGEQAQPQTRIADSGHKTHCFFPNGPCTCAAPEPPAGIETLWHAVEICEQNSSRWIQVETQQMRQLLDAASQLKERDAEIANLNQHWKIEQSTRESMERSLEQLRELLSEWIEAAEWTVAHSDSISTNSEIGKAALLLAMQRRIDRARAMLSDA